MHCPQLLSVHQEIISARVNGSKFQAQIAKPEQLWQQRGLSLQLREKWTKRGWLVKTGWGQSTPEAAVALYNPSIN